MEAVQLSLFDMMTAALPTVAVCCMDGSLVDRTEPSGNDFLKNAGRRRPLKKKGVSECDDRSA